jgi:hypothetical protein
MACKFWSSLLIERLIELLFGSLFLSLVASSMASPLGAPGFWADHGIDLGLGYRSEFRQKFAGGEGAARSSYLGALDLKLSLDGQKFFRVPGLTSFIVVV